jgi:large subunit ribosomal protein L20
MARVKTGPHRHRHHKKILKVTKGQFGTRHRLFRRANEAMLKSMCMRVAHRRNHKRDLRRLWIAALTRRHERHHLQQVGPQHEDFPIQ